MAFGTKSAKTVVVKPPSLERINIPIKGTAPLIMHRFSAKAKRMMLEKQMQESKQAAKVREPRQPTEDFVESMYILGERPKDYADWKKNEKKWRYCFPSLGFKVAITDAAGQVDGITKVFLRGAFRIIGEDVEIFGRPEMREDMVKNQTGVADIRFRACFEEWSASVPVVYNKDVIDPGQIVNLLNMAGFAVGIGDWRPQRDGNKGTFEVDVSKMKGDDS